MQGREAGRECLQVAGRGRVAAVEALRAQDAQHECPIDVVLTRDPDEAVRELPRKAARGRRRVTEVAVEPDDSAGVTVELEIRGSLIGRHRAGVAAGVGRLAVAGVSRRVGTCGGLVGLSARAVATAGGGVATVCGLTGP